MSKQLPDDTTVEKYMEHYMPRALNRHPDKLDGLDCVLQFSITGAGGGEWALAVKDRAATVTRGPAVAPRCTFEASAANWLALVQGKLNGPLAFMTGKVKMHGDYFFAMKLASQLMAALGSLKT